MKSLRNTKNGRIFTWTPELAALPHMVLCDDVAVALEPLEHSAPADPAEVEQKKSKPPKKPKAADGGDQ